jgi:sugar lactone lactonase YvrE
MEEKYSRTKAQTLVASECILGESPMWHARRKSCFWVDIDCCKIYEYNWLTKFTRSYDLNNKVSLVVAGKDNDLIVALQGGVFRFDLETEELLLITDLGENWLTNRCNDGISDNRGRLWVSAMGLQHENGAGSVYRIDKPALYQKCIREATIPNGMAFSLDHKRLYYIDSPARSVNSYLYNEESGSISFEKLLILIPERSGIPDGMTIDAEGKLWIALWGGYGVGRFDTESGMMIDFIDVPAPHVSSCAFAGKELDHMIITTAKSGLGQKALIDFPESGNIFVAQPGITGIADFTCKL